MVSSVVTLILTIGWASAIALSTFFILGVINAVLGRLSQKQVRDALSKADRRLGIMSEIINGIKAIKLCGVFVHSLGGVCIQIRTAMSDLSCKYRIALLLQV